MGIVKVRASVGSSRENLSEMEFLVDTGSFYTALTPAARDELGLPPGVPAEIQLADGRIVESEVTVAYLKYNGRQGVVPVEIAEVPYPLLGASALEVLGLAVNPVDDSLEERLPFPGTIRFTRFPA